MSEKDTSLKRNEFLKVAAAGTGAFLTLRLTQRAEALVRQNQPQAAAEEGEHKWALIIDQSRCIGCGYCTNACRANNDVPPDFAWTRVAKVGDFDKKEVFLPTQCMHCDQAPCVDVCPVGASYKREDGIVMMDYDRCIGCRYCQVACPYGARYFNWEKFTGDNPYVPEWGYPDVERRPRGVVEKCTFCVNRIDRGLSRGLTPGIDLEANPACVNICPTGARVFGDLNDPESRVSKILASSTHYRLREDLGTSPRIYYLPVNTAAQNTEAGS